MPDQTPDLRPFLRLLALLRDRPGVTGPQLAEALGCSPATVRRQIRALRDAGVMIESSNRTGHRVTDWGPIRRSKLPAA